MKVYFSIRYEGRWHPRASNGGITIHDVGLIDEDGRSFYGEISDQLSRIDTVCSTVVNTSISGKTEHDIRNTLRAWLSAYPKIQFVSDHDSHIQMCLLIDLYTLDNGEPLISVCPTCHNINQDIARYLDITDSEAYRLDRQQFILQYAPNILIQLQDKMLLNTPSIGRARLTRYIDRIIQ